MTVQERAKFEKRIGSPVGIRSYNPLVNSDRVKFKKVKARDSGIVRSARSTGRDLWSICLRKSLGRRNGQEFAGFMVWVAGTKEDRRTEVETDTHSKR
jgi:hypothetical protein